MKIKIWDHRIKISDNTPYLIRYEVRYKNKKRMGKIITRYLYNPFYELGLKETDIKRLDESENKTDWDEIFGFCEKK